MAYKKWSKEMNETHDWKKEKVLEGIFVEVRTVSTKNGDSLLYTIEKEGGETVDFWGKAQLDRFFRNIKRGTKVKMTYLGKVDSAKGGRSYHDFDVEYDDSTALEEDSDIVEVAKKEFGI